MKRLSEDRLTNRFEVIFRELKGLGRGFNPIERRAAAFVVNGKTLVLEGKGLEAYWQAVDEILKDQFFSDNFSRRYVEQKIVRDYLAQNYKKYLTGSLDIRRGLSRRIQTLRKFNEKYHVIVPLGGIEINRKGNLNVGNVEIGLFRGKDFPFKKLRAIPSLRDFLVTLKGKVVAAIEVQGEPDKAKETAYSEVTNALNVLRLYVRAFFFRTTDVQIRTSSHFVMSSGHFTLVDEGTRKIIHGGENPAGSLTFKIDKHNLGKMRKNGFSELSKMLKMSRRDLTPFEREILLAINWYGMAVDMTDPVLKFLSYAIVLEVLLSKQERDSDRTITDKLAEGVAFLLGEGYENRKQIKQDVKKIYALRSAIIHGGRDFVEDKESRLVEYIALRSIWRLIKKRKAFPSKQALLDWVEKRRLG
jgi:hypothetical protein